MGMHANRNKISVFSKLYQKIRRLSKKYNWRKNNRRLLPVSRQETHIEEKLDLATKLVVYLNIITEIEGRKQGE